MRALLLVLVSSVAFADPSFKIEQGKLVVPSSIAFEPSSDKLTPASEDAIKYVTAFLAEKKDITSLRIENHTDASDGQALTEKRALAVARALVKHGVECARLIPVGFGGTKPVAANDTPDNKAKNRRTEFAMAALRGHAIGGGALDGGGKVAGDPCH